MATKKIIEDAPLDDAPVADDDYDGIDGEGTADDDGTFNLPATDEQTVLDDTVPLQDYASEIQADPQRHLNPITDDVERDPSLPPPPITPSTPTAEAQDRVHYENWLNGEAEGFGLTARLTFANATIAGFTARLVVEDEDGNVVESDRYGNVTVDKRDTDG